MSDTGSVVVLGSGAAGTAAARRLADAGWSVTVVEKDKVGGTCLWHGCMPKKALAVSAHAMREMTQAEQFGVICETPEYDWPSVLAWKWHAQETYAGDQVAGLADRGISLVRGSARFSNDNSVEVDGTVLGFDHAVIATGSEPILPDIPGIELADTSAEALGYREPPSHLLIVGGGFIGLEFAGIYASFGTRVTVVTSGERPLSVADADVVAVVLRHLGQLGVRFVTSRQVTALSGQTGAIAAELSEGNRVEPPFETFDRVIMSVGRRPAVGTLAVDNAGIQVDPRGRLVVDTAGRTSNERVWAAGDAAGGMMQTPVASYEGRTVAASILGGVPLPFDTSAVPTTTFTIPHIATVGLTEAAAAAAGIAYRVASTTFEFLGAAIIEDDRDGLVKLLFAEDDGRLLGAHIAGPTASDLIYALALAVRHRHTAEDLQVVLGIHPAYSEAINWASFA